MIKTTRSSKRTQTRKTIASGQNQEKCNDHTTNEAALIAKTKR